MGRVFKAIVLSLLLHLLLLWLFIDHLNELKFLPPHKQEKSISLNLKQIITPPPASKPLPKSVLSASVVKPVIQKPVPKIAETKKPFLDTKKRVVATKSVKEHNSTKVIQKLAKKILKKSKKTVTKKLVIKKVIKKKHIKKRHLVKRKAVKRRAKRSKDPLANMLMGAGSSLRAKRHTNRKTYGERLIQKLYGKVFHTFTPSQKNYIRNNLNRIHQITQRTLVRNGYPDVAIRTRQQGTNIVSFYLHPNGDITGLRLKKHIGYEALDKNTLQIIRLAYKDYPLPKQKTKIVFYVQYSINY